MPTGRGKKCIPPNLFEKTMLVTRILSKSAFRVVLCHQNDMTLKTLLLQILVTKMIFSSKLGGIHFFPLPVGKRWAYIDRFYCPNSDFKGKRACSGLSHTSKGQVLNIFFDQKLRLLKILKFGKGLRFLRCGALIILKYVKTSKMVKMCNFIIRLKSDPKIKKLRLSEMSIFTF